MLNNNQFVGYRPTWCPGCGNWGILTALQQALVELNFNPSQIAIVFGIGCSGNMNDFLNAYSFHALHGRAIPNAIGIKIANHKLSVIAVVGDGDCYGEGGNHLIHAFRGNHDITVLVHDNRVYGLTTGQVAPTAKKGFKSKSTPLGIIEEELSPLALAVTQGSTFVAQAFAGDVVLLKELIKQAIIHKGLSLVNILQPCVTFNKINTYQYYQERVYKLEESHQKDNYELALKKMSEIKKEKFPIGIIYQINKPTFTDQLCQLKEKTLVEKERFKDFYEIVKEFI